MRKLSLLLSEGQRIRGKSLMSDHVPFQEKPICSIAEAKAALSVGNTTLYKLISEGRIETIRIGTRQFCKVSSVLAVAEQGYAPKQKSPPIRRGPRRRQPAEVA